MTSASPFVWEAYQTPKRGSAPEECEDAWAAGARAGRFAIADGASESAFAGLWARLLVEHFVREPQPWNNADWLAGPRRAWVDAVTPLELPWYAEIKRAEGAFAAFLGIAVRPPRDEAPGRWRVLVVGDCCLLWLRCERLRRAFPLRHASEFGHTPLLLGSRGGTPEPRRSQGLWNPGDELLLASDALACWFLHEREAGRRPWTELRDIAASAEPPAAFAAWIDDARQYRGLRNDDVTLLRLSLPSVGQEAPDGSSSASVGPEAHDDSAHHNADAPPAPDGGTNPPTATSKQEKRDVC
jgi:serine/threonine protein phosphatase PrpC